MQRLPNCAGATTVCAARCARAAHCSGNAAKCSMPGSTALFSCHPVLADPMQIILHRSFAHVLKNRFALCNR
jgi:hypothetical protein